MQSDSIMKIHDMTETSSSKSILKTFCQSIVRVSYFSYAVLCTVSGVLRDRDVTHAEIVTPGVKGLKY
jgi:hypothetical protein